MAIEQWGYNWDPLRKSNVAGWEISELSMDIAEIIEPVPGDFPASHV